MKFNVLKIGYVSVHIEKPNIFLRLITKLVGLRIEEIESEPYAVFVDTTHAEWAGKENGTYTEDK